jgi:hypothetical protein
MKTLRETHVRKWLGRKCWGGWGWKFLEIIGWEGELVLKETSIWKVWWFESLRKMIKVCEKFLKLICRKQTFKNLLQTWEDKSFTKLWRRTPDTWTSQLSTRHTFEVHTLSKP